MQTFICASFVRGFLCSALLLLTACGGGSGASTGGSNELPKDAAQASITSLTPAQAQWLVGRVAALPGYANVASQVSALMLDLAAPTGVTQNAERCARGGAMQLELLDADRDGTLSAGDTGTLKADKCQLPGGWGLSGQVKAMVTAASGGASQYYTTTDAAWALATSQTYSSFVLEANEASATLNGTVAVRDAAATSHYQLDQFKAVGTTTPDFLTVHGAMEASMVLGMATPMRGFSFADVVLQTNLPSAEVVTLTLPASAQQVLVFNPAGQVASGKLTLQLDKVQVVATVVALDQVRVEVDNHRDGTVDATQVLSWPDLHKQSSLR